MSTQRTLRVKDVSSILNISTHTLYRIIKENDIPVIVYGNRKLLPPNSVRKIFEARKFQFKKLNMPKAIAVSGMKGGTGKTTIAQAISEGASRLGFRVLVIDLDMQGNITLAFNSKHPDNLVMLDIVNGTHSPNEVILEVHPYLHIIPSSLKNSVIELSMNSQQIDTPNYFKTIFQDYFDNYDLIIMDCPPSINKITGCATCFADLNLFPINADIDSFDGVAMSVGEIKRLERSFRSQNIKLNYKIVFNKYDAREKLSLAVMGKVAQDEHLAENLLQIVVRTDTAFKNTKAELGSIFDLSKSAGREDCLNLIAEVTGINPWLEENSKNTEKEQEVEATIEL